MTKAGLRHDFLTQRKALTSDEVEQRSQRIASHFFTYVEEESLATIQAFFHSFLPISRHNEVNTWPILEAFREKFTHIGISVPVTEPFLHQMAHYTLRADTSLIENELGIPEPAKGHRYETDLRHIKAVLVPLLAFDQHGHRVGYGGGYYDRFLAEDVPDSRKIGLSLFEPVSQIDDVVPTDVRLDACITPTRVYRFP